MLYTVKNCVEEYPELVYNDGVKRLFLYVGGELGGTEKLKSLLQYFSDSNTGNVTDAELEHLHSIVEHAKKTSFFQLAENGTEKKLVLFLYNRFNMYIFIDR